MNNHETSQCPCCCLNQLNSKSNTCIRITLYTLAHAKKDHSAGETWHILLREVAARTSMECWTYY